MPAKNPNSNGGNGRPKRDSVIKRATARHEKHRANLSWASRCEQCNPSASVMDVTR